MFLVALAVVGRARALFIPTLVDQVDNFANKVPDYVRDLTHGRGRLGFLETRYHIVERVKQAVKSGGVGKFAVGAGAALTVTKSVLTAVAATLTIVFMTFFMLLEGPDVDGPDLRRAAGAVAAALAPGRARHLPHGRRLRHRQPADQPDRRRRRRASCSGSSACRTPSRSGSLVALLDLIPLAGATIAAVLVVLVAIAASGTTAAIIVAVFFVVYQQLENHLIQPLVYGRTVQLSPLAVLVSVLIGAQIAGVLGALAAIPIAGTLQVLLLDWRAAPAASSRACDYVLSRALWFLVLPQGG